MIAPDISAKTAATVPNCPSCHGVRSTPRVTGIVDWKTIAPATLPSAITSFPSFVQMRLFAASGSSVASGARISATSRVLKPMACEKSSTKSAKNRAPSRIAPNDTSTCVSTSHIGGFVGTIFDPKRCRYLANVRSPKASRSSFSSSTSSAVLRGVRRTR